MKQIQTNVVFEILEKNTDKIVALQGQAGQEKPIMHYCGLYLVIAIEIQVKL